MKFLIICLSSVLVFSLFMPTAFAQYYDAVLVLDPIPSQVKVGDPITFSGQLSTTDGQVIRQATIFIKDDVTFGIDTVLGSLTTDENGKFTRDWESKLRPDGGAYDFYAYYEGASDVSYARSQTHSVTVVTASGSSYTPSSTSSYNYEPTEITLNSIPKTVSIGQIITFSGKLTSNGQPLSNAKVWIKDEDFADLNDFLTSATTDSTGKFSANWKVKNVDSGDRQFSALILDLYGGLGEATQLNHLYNLAEANTVEIYAEFEGNNQYSKSNTCLIENVDGVLQSNCYNKILSIQDDSSFENLIMSMLLSEIGVDIEGTDSLESILTNQADSMDVANFEDLLLEALQDELDLGNTDLTMEQMLQLLDDPSLASQYQSKSSPSPQQSSSAPTVLDSDNDGIPDSRDSCKFSKENYNGYQDTDGCPDTKPVPKTAQSSPSISTTKPTQPSSPIQESAVRCGEGTVLKDGTCVLKSGTVSKSSSGGCLIATAAFGTELALQVQQLRELRDNTLLQTESGSAFMTGFNEFYYSFSPGIADLERQNPVFKEMVKLAITPLITSLSILNYVEIESEAEVLGYGISLILLNVGMYFAAPAIFVIKLKKFYL